MRSIPMTLGWEIVTRERWKIVACLIQLALIGLIGLVIPDRWSMYGWVALVPLVVAYCLTAIGIFLVGAYNFRLGRSGYQANLFTFPVSTRDLITYPMILAAFGVSVGWFALTLALRVWKVELPILLPALGTVAGVAWLLALSWWPFGSDTVRVLVSIVVVTLLTVIAVWPASAMGWGPVVYLVALPIDLVLAYFVAWRGVAVDRRGDGRNPLGLMAMVQRAASRMTPSLPKRASIDRAQAWFEWRTKGAVLPGLVCGIGWAILFIMLLLPGGNPGDVRSKVTISFLAVVGLIPLGLASILGGGFGKDDFGSRDFRLGSFLGTKPVTTRFLALSRMRSSALSLAIAWGLMLAAMPLWIYVSGNVEPIANLWRGYTRFLGPSRAALAVGLALVSLFALGWKGMLGSMVTAFTGRAWVANVAAFCSPVLAGVLVGLGLWLSLDDQGYRAFFAAILPWVLSVLLVAKLVLAAWGFRRGLDRKMIGPAWLAGSVTLYLAIAGLMIGFAVVGLRPEWRPPWLWVILLGLLIPPLGRFSWAPLALEWNRRR